jgi:hypothetical protein
MEKEPNQKDAKKIKRKIKELPQYEVDTTTFDWSKRFTDPYIKMIWNALIKVEAANSTKGQYFGFRTYPDGTREQFELKH